MIEPPGENFTAFDSRLKRICFRRASSRQAVAICGSTDVTMLICDSCAVPFITRSTDVIVSRRSKVSKFTRSFPASIFDRSRMSLIRLSRYEPAVLMFSRKR